MRNVILFMFLLREFSVIFNLYFPLTNIKCKVFEDKQSCIQVYKTPKFTPRTKLISIKYHHVCSYIKNGYIEILPIDTHKHTEDIFTKPLKYDTLFLYLRLKLSGW